MSEIFTIDALDPILPGGNILPCMVPRVLHTLESQCLQVDICQEVCIDHQVMYHCVGFSIIAETL